MTHPRIHFPLCPEKGDLCRISGEQRHYLKSVLRMKAGETVVLFDGKGSEYEGIIRQEIGDELVVEIINRFMTAGRDSVKVTLCQSIPKADKIDFIVQKSTELGVHRIIPFLSDRSVPKLSGEKARLKTARWRKIAMEACRQSRGKYLPAIEDILDFDKMIARLAANSLKIILWEEETTRGLRQVFENNRVRCAEEIIIAIGPEGGFTGEEINKATGCGFTSAGLGKLILRLETAAIAALSIVQYELGVIGATEGQQEKRGKGDAG